ncbi:MAG: CRISPR system precrRNA processing endoribonuclease RAMP protein Cas6 [Anaerolineae bacterium]|nr:CRISPR system precrRNA processing endoribonuclease RAMP protein Cas6 [Anaerolineae bacterium]
MLDKLRIAKYRFRLQAVERLGLPRYKGSTLRGGFGAVFKRTVCFQKEVKSCADCLLKANCPYAYIFETSPPQDAEVLRTYSDVPLPFVIEPPLDTKTVYEPGEMLDFGLVLVGRAINYLPYFIVVFKELGRVGLGRGRGRYRLREVAAVQPLDGVEETIYSAANEMVCERDLSVGWKEIEAQASNVKRETSNVKPETSRFALTVNFLTPTRMKHEGRFVDRPEFHVLVRNILRRVSSLYYFHCGEKWEVDYRGIIEAAKEVRLAEARTGWVDWERYSRRQQQRMNLGGLVGQVTYEGDASAELSTGLEPFLPLLVLGELVHVGKACVFGHGKYEVVIGY